MYTLTFYLKDVNDNILAILHSISEIAALFNDSNILNCKNDLELIMYLLEHHFHAVINGVKFYFANQDISNTDMSITLTYKQL